MNIPEEAMVYCLHKYYGYWRNGTKIILIGEDSEKISTNILAKEIRKETEFDVVRIYTKRFPFSRDISFRDFDLIVAVRPCVLGYNPHRKNLVEEIIRFSIKNNKTFFILPCQRGDSVERKIIKLIRKFKCITLAEPVKNWIIISNKEIK